MSSQVTITMNKQFLDWWKRLASHIQEDQTIMLIAWWAWNEAEKQFQKEGT